MGKTANDLLYERASRAVRDLFDDDTVSPDVTRTNLELLMGELEDMLDALPEYDDEE